MHERNQPSDDELVRRVDACHSLISKTQRELFRLIAACDRRELWRGSGARDMAHWLWMRFGLSDWKARRWIAAAHSLERLPLVENAFSRGDLGIDKVVELTRFATEDTEAGLLAWAFRVSPGAIRRRADVEARRKLTEAGGIEHARFLRYWYFDGGRRFGLEAELPSAAGKVVQDAIDRALSKVPAMPGEEHNMDARRADALVALASEAAAGGAGPDKPIVVLHARLGEAGTIAGSCEIDGGGVIQEETARRLACDARIQVVLEDEKGEALRLGRMSRVPTSAIARQLRYRDRECRFPGCGARRFAQAHHVKWWSLGGKTDLDNLVLLCTFHHKLVHEHGWHLKREAGGVVRWFRPDGSPYRAGPAPPERPTEHQPEPVATPR